MPAHPVELIQIDRLFPQNDHPDLGEPGEQSAPYRQDEDGEKTQVIQALSAAARFRPS